MGTETNAEWRKSARQLPALLASLPRDTPDGGLRLLIFALWRQLARAPGPIRHLYAQLPETDVRAAADAADRGRGEADLGLAAADLASDKAIVLAIAARLRALEDLVASFDQGEGPVDPNEDWRISLADDEAFFVPLPRSAWRVDPPKERPAGTEGNSVAVEGGEADPTPRPDLRPFDQRGLLKVRIIPAVVDGAIVRLHLPEDPGRGPALGRFGAALFPDLGFEEVTGPGRFRITGVTGPNLPDHIHAACRAAHAADYRAVIFPELTIDPTGRDYLEELLQEKPWNDDAATRTVHTPAVVVAGSWHDPVVGGFANVATVFDGHGEVLLRHHKRFAYKDPSDRFEDIVPGEHFEVLVLPDGLHAFSICLDFCQRWFDTAYGDLDVDFVLVPSCGDDRTMESHVETATDLHRRRRARAFVVQQAYPKRDDGFGFVLPPDGAPKGKSPSDLLKRDPWSVFPS